MARIVTREVQDPNSGSITNEKDRDKIKALCDEAVRATGGELLLGQTKVETRMLVSDDDLEEISCFEAWTRWRAIKSQAE